MLELVGPAMRVLVRSALGMAALTVLLALGSFYVAAPSSPARGLVAAALSLLIGAILGAILAVKRAVCSALQAGLERLELGRRVLEIVFARLSSIAGVVETLPFAQAEQKLHNAVATIARTENGGWLRGQLRTRLLQFVERITLARFRAEGASGIDLRKVQIGLSAEIDGLIAAQASAMQHRTTMLLILATAALSLGAATALRLLPL